MKKNWIKLGVLSIFFSFSFTACNEEKKNDNIKIAPITFTKEGEAYLIRSTGDTIEKLDIEFAETDYEKQTGLMYRESMKDSQGMIFIYDSEGNRNFYMKNTYIPLDIIYYDADSSLVSIQKNAEPRSERSLPSEAPSQYVLEVNAGLSDNWELTQGDKLSFSRTD